MANSKVSIIVPNYNHAIFLRKRIESIFNQSFKDFEIIILDDASTDNSIDILRQYARHPKVSHLIINTQNSGSPFKQWKKGIELAKGEYIWIAESDDYCEPIFLEKLITALEQHPYATICASNLIKVDEKDQLLVKRTNYSDCFYDGSTILKQSFTTGNFLWNASAVVFKKEALENIDWIKIETMKYCGDWLFWIKLIEKGGLVTISHYLSYFRIHSHSVSSSSLSQWRFFKEGLEIVHYINQKTPLTCKERELVRANWLRRLKQSTLDNKQKLEIKDGIYMIFSTVNPISLLKRHVSKILQYFRSYMLL